MTRADKPVSNPQSAETYDLEKGAWIEECYTNAMAPLVKHVTMGHNYTRSGPMPHAPPFLKWVFLWYSQHPTTPYPLI